MSKLRFGMMGLAIAGSMAVSTYGARANGPQPFSWNGPYIGGSVGAAWTNDSARVSTPDAANEAVFGQSLAAGRIASS